MSEDIIVRHCSPTLAGMKTGNMFSCPFADEDEMKKYTLAGKIGSVLAKDLNNRLAVYKWQGR